VATSAQAPFHVRVKKADGSDDFLPVSVAPLLSLFNKNTLHALSTCFKLSNDCLSPTPWAKMCVGNAVALIDQTTIDEVAKSQHEHAPGLFVWLSWMKRWWLCFGSRLGVTRDTVHVVLQEMKTVKEEFDFIMGGERKPEQQIRQLSADTGREVALIMDSFRSLLTHIFFDETKNVREWITNENVNVCVGKWGTDICEYIFSAARARYNQAGNLTASMTTGSVAEIRAAARHDLATSASGSGQLVCATASTADTTAVDITDMPAGTSRQGPPRPETRQRGQYCGQPGIGCSPTHGG